MKDSEIDTFPFFIKELTKSLEYSTGIIDIQDKLLDDFGKAVKDYYLLVRRTNDKDSEFYKSYSQKDLLLQISYVIQTGVRFLSLIDNNKLYFYNEDSGIYEDGAENIIRFIGHMLNPILSVHYLKEIVDKIIIENYHSRVILNPDHLIGVKNGVIDRTSFELKPKSWENFLTRAIPANYNPDAYPTKWEYYVDSITDEKNKRILLEALGYCLHPGYPFHRAFLLFGPTHTGKSTFLKFIKAFLGGDNCSHVTLQQLEREDKLWYRSKLFGKLANLSPDMPNKAVYNTGIFKAVTGEDQILAEEKGLKPFEFENSAKAWFSGNDIPPSEGDDSDAYYIRWIILDFPNAFTNNADPDLINKISTDEELSGVLNAALMSLHNLLDRGQFEYHIDIEAKTKAYDMGSNTVKAFVKYECVVRRDLTTPKADLYDAYKVFCEDLGREPKAKNAFTSELDRWTKGIKTDRPQIDGKRIYVYRGVALDENSKYKNTDVSRVSRLIPFSRSVSSKLYKLDNSLNSTSNVIVENKKNLGNLDNLGKSKKKFPSTLIGIEDFISISVSEGNGRGAEVNDILDKGENLGLDREEVKKTIDKLVGRGFYFEPSSGVIMRP